MLRKRNVQNLLTVTVLLVAFVLGCSKSQPANNPRETAKVFTAVAGELAQLPAKEELTSEPYVKGKLLMIRQSPTGAFYVDAFDAGQLGDIYARTPDEVQTVALTICERKQKGIYRTNEDPPRDLPAYVTDCDVTLIDRSVPAVIFRKRFEAKLQEKAGAINSTQEINAFPDYEIRDFLKALPRK